MGIEIRACRDREELRQYGEVVAYAFAVNDPTDLRAELDAVRPEWTTCAFDGGRAVSTLGRIPLGMRLNGRRVDVGAITAVGTLPGFRRQGLLRETMRAALATLHDAGTPLALLWASMGAIYQRFGFGLAAPNVSYAANPRDATLLPGYAPAGACRLIERETARDVIGPIYERFAAPRNLLLHRSDYLWEWSTLRQKANERVYVAVYRNAEGRDSGYVVYKTREEETPGHNGPPQVLDIADWAWLDLDACAGTWQFLCQHDLVREIRMRWLCGEDDPLPLMLAEPRSLNAKVADGTWMRIVDVAKALEARPYRAAGRLRIAVRDEFCPWNDGTWELEAGAAGCSVKRSDAAEDLAMPVASLATMLAGHRRATVLERAGRIEPASRAALLTADAMFATDYAPYTPNMF